MENFLTKPSGCQCCASSHVEKEVQIGHLTLRLCRLCTRDVVASVSRDLAHRYPWRESQYPDNPLVAYPRTTPHPTTQTIAV